MAAVRSERAIVTVGKRDAHGSVPLHDVAAARRRLVLQLILATERHEPRQVVEAWIRMLDIALRIEEEALESRRVSER